MDEGLRCVLIKLEYLSGEGSCVHAWRESAERERESVERQTARCHRETERQTAGCQGEGERGETDGALSSYTPSPETHTLSRIIIHALSHHHTHALS